MIAVAYDHRFRGYRREIEDAFTDECGRRLLSRAVVSEITGGWRAYCATFRRHCPYKDLPKTLGIEPDGVRSVGPGRRGRRRVEQRRLDGPVSLLSDENLHNPLSPIRAAGVTIGNYSRRNAVASLRMTSL